MAAIDTVTQYQADFEQAARRVAGQPAWLVKLRQDAFDRFTALGFPNTRQEEWRFTNVAPIAEGQFQLAPRVTVDEAAVAALGLVAPGIDLAVVVNGKFDAGLSSIGSLPPGTVIGGLRQLLSTDGSSAAAYLGRVAQYDAQPFVALNTAFLDDGLLIYVPANAVLERPLHLVAITASDAEHVRVVAHPRVLVIAAENSQVRLVESYVGQPAAGSSARFTNAVTEIVLQDGAVVDHYRVQREPRDAYHMATTGVRLGHGSTFVSHAFTFGGGLVRHDVNVVLASEGGDCTLNGLYLGDGSRLVDNHTFIDHAMPHCTSHELYKGILGGRARAVFNGKILVRPDAQKTDAKQTNKTLLLSDDAQINTKPQLEIYANDVKCTHGATIGQLSADAMFYLQARGIGREDARRMLIRAFAGDITSRVRVEPLREALDTWLLEALEGK